LCGQVTDVRLVTCVVQVEAWPRGGKLCWRIRVPAICRRSRRRKFGRCGAWDPSGST
jgi:hypothetical protein